jgi:DNA-binding CsgD family transcriptional regulator
MSVVAPNPCLHPWLTALDSFDVPFLGYSARGDLLYASSGVLSTRLSEAGGLRRQAALLAADAVGARPPHVSRSQWVQLRAAPAAGHPLLLKLFVCREVAEPLPIAVILSPRPATEDRAAHLALSARQSEVARLIANGAAVKEVAALLGISVHTARRHVEHVYRRLGLHSRAEVARALG